MPRRLLCEAYRRQVAIAETDGVFTVNGQVADQLVNVKTKARRAAPAHCVGRLVVGASVPGMPARLPPSRRASPARSLPPPWHRGSLPLARAAAVQPARACDGSHGQVVNYSKIGLGVYSREVNPDGSTVRIHPAAAEYYSTVRPLEYCSTVHPFECCRGF